MSEKNKQPAEEIVFGFDRKSDEKSLDQFLQRFTEKSLLDVLLPRMQDEDILATVDFLTGMMHRHLTEKEYHELFLKD